MKLNRPEIDLKNGQEAHDKIFNHQSTDKCKLKPLLGTTTHLLELLKIKTSNNTNWGENTEHLEISYITDQSVK